MACRVLQLLYLYKCITITWKQCFHPTLTTQFSEFKPIHFHSSQYSTFFFLIVIIAMILSIQRFCNLTHTHKHSRISPFLSNCFLFLNIPFLNLFAISIVIHISIFSYNRRHFIRLTWLYNARGNEEYYIVYKLVDNEDV